MTLDSWTENPELAVKLGLYYLQDFKTKIVFSRNVISGCCDLPDNIIYDKKTWEELVNIGPIVWCSENRAFPLIIYFGNSSTKKDQVSSEFRNLVILNLDTNKEFYFDLSAYKFFEDLDDDYVNYDWNFVESYKVENTALLITFRKQHKGKEGEFITQVIKLNLRAYGT